MEQERVFVQAKIEPKTSQGSPKWPPVDKYSKFEDLLIISGLISESFWDLIPKKMSWKFNVGIDTQTIAKTFATIS